MAGLDALQNLPPENADGIDPLNGAETAMASTLMLYAAVSAYNTLTPHLGALAQTAYDVSSNYLSGPPYQFQYTAPNTWIPAATRWYQGHTLLTQAVASQNYEAVDSLCQLYDVNEANTLGETPLSIALQADDHQMVKQLIEAGVKVDKAVIIEQIQQNNANMVESLLTPKCSKEDLIGYIETAIQSENYNLIQSCIDAKPEYDLNDLVKKLSILHEPRITQLLQNNELQVARLAEHALANQNPVSLALALQYGAKIDLANIENTDFINESLIYSIIHKFDVAVDNLLKSPLADIHKPIQTTHTHGSAYHISFFSRAKINAALRQAHRTTQPAPVQGPKNKNPFTSEFEEMMEKLSESYQTVSYRKKITPDGAVFYNPIIDSKEYDVKTIFKNMDWSQVRFTDYMVEKIHHVYKEIEKNHQDIENKQISTDDYDYAAKEKQLEEVKRQTPALPFMHKWRLGELEEEKMPFGTSGQLTPNDIYPIRIYTNVFSSNALNPFMKGERHFFVKYVRLRDSEVKNNEIIKDKWNTHLIAPTFLMVGLTANTINKVIPSDPDQIVCRGQHKENTKILGHTAAFMSVSESFQTCMQFNGKEDLLIFESNIGASLAELVQSESYEESIILPQTIDPNRFHKFTVNGKEIHFVTVPVGLEPEPLDKQQDSQTARPQNAPQYDASKQTQGTPQEKKQQPDSKPTLRNK